MDYWRGAMRPVLGTDMSAGQTAGPVPLRITRLRSAEALRERSPACDLCRMPGCALGLVGHRERGKAAVLLLLDLPRNGREPFGDELRVPHGAPRLNELARRIRLDDLAVDDHLRRTVTCQAGVTRRTSRGSGGRKATPAACPG